MKENRLMHRTNQGENDPQGVRVPMNLNHVARKTNYFNSHHLLNNWETN